MLPDALFQEKKQNLFKFFRDTAKKFPKALDKHQKITIISLVM